MLKTPLIKTPIALAISAMTLISPLVMAASGVGEIVALSGKADYREQEQQPWRAAALRQSLAPASFVRTAELSAISIVLADQAQIRLGQNTVFQVRAVNAAPQQVATSLNLLRGRAWSQTKNVARSGFTMTTPTVAAGIHGTDWVMEVDDAGTTTMTVLSGVVELANAAGKIDVNAGEQGYVEAGKAPVKRVLVNARERVQWVSLHRIDFSHYPELNGPLAESLKAADFGAAATRAAELRATAPSATAWLLGGELHLVAGDADAAQKLLSEGADRYPDDRRFAVLLGRTALFRDQPAEARQRIVPLVAKHPDFVNGLLALGELERLDGRGPEAADAFQRAANVAPKDARPWLGLGKVETERERVRSAVYALDKAEEVGGKGTGAAERGTLATFNDQPTLAEQNYDQALKADPADYVALTGLGIARLKAGDNDGALEALLRANTIEPRYARSAIYMGIAYYRQGKTKAALSSLQRATELDPNDPLPHVYAALIKRDEWRPAEALVDAKLATEKMPKLKSLNQLANDRQGSANVGGTLADLGLEVWAGALAQDSALATWAGSHLFLADRYDGSFNRNSELMQGFLTDPTVFGASQRRQSLLVEPGVHGELLAGFNVNDLHRGNRQLLNLSGFSNSVVPVAGFLQLQRLKIDPKSNDAVEAKDFDGTIGFGIKPRYDLGLFLYATKINIDTQGSLDESGRSLDTEGKSWRYDIGGSWRYSPNLAVMLKVGALGEEINGKLTGTPGFTLDAPKQRDVQLNIYGRLAPSHELLGGWEGNTADRTFYEGTINRALSTRFGVPVTVRTGPIEETDEHRTWVQWRYRGEQGARVEVFLADHDYDKSTTVVSENIIPGQATRRAAFPPETYQKHRTDVRLGLAGKFADVTTLRFAWQDWIRPNGFNTLAPVADAGIPLADQYVLPGGRQQRVRGELEWNLAERSFFRVFAESMKVDNVSVLGSTTIDDSRKSLAELDVLQGARVKNLPTAESLDGRPFFQSGSIKQYGISFSHLLQNGLAFETAYVRAQTERGVDDIVQDKPLPYIPKNRFTATLASSNGNWRWQAQAAYRGERYANDSEFSAVTGGAGSLLKAQWGLNGRFGWRSDGRQWEIDLFGDDLGQKSYQFGLQAVYRF